MNKLPVNKPLPRYEKQFSLLTQEEQDAIIFIQTKYPFNWWNPDCKTKCLKHKIIHKYSFESYVEGWVKGYFGFDTIEEINFQLKETQNV